MSRLLDKLRETVDPDRLLQATTGAFIEAAGTRYAMGREGSRYEAGKPLRLLFAGYAGARNTGADVRVEEMIRQFRHVLGDENLELSICTLDPKLTAGYFRTVKQVPTPKVFPKFLYDELTRHHGVVACEGSMFKSKFADALTTFMAGSLGMANVEGKLSIGYGAEAGAMSPGLTDFVRKHCRQSLVLCRNEPSRDVLGALGIRTTSGTDTAWTFSPAPPEVGDKMLRDAGWDGVAPVLAVCPINPFWWPIRPDVGKAVAHLVANEFDKDHHESVYFHEWDQEKAALYDAYLDGLAVAVNTFCAEIGAFPVLVAMEQLDRRSAEQLLPRLDRPAPLFVSDTFDMYEMVSMLHQCTYMVSSRFHAIVTSMSGGVASCGVTMDERIRNLMVDRGHPHLFCEVDDPDVGEATLAMLRHLHENREEIREDILRRMPHELRKMGEMGMVLADEVLRIYPEFPLPVRPRTWQAHLPPLGPLIQRLVDDADALTASPLPLPA